MIAHCVAAAPALAVIIAVDDDHIRGVMPLLPRAKLGVAAIRHPDRHDISTIGQLNAMIAKPKNLVKMDAVALETGIIDGQAFTALCDYFWQQAKTYHATWIN